MPMSSQSWNRYSYVLNNPINASDPSGHKCVGEPDECLSSSGSSRGGFTGGASGYKGSGWVENSDASGEGGKKPDKRSDKNNGKNDGGPITELILQLPGSAEDWSHVATGLDVLAWSTDVYAAGAVTYAYFAGAALPAPLIAAGLPEVPLVTGFAGMALAELYVQPILVTGNVIATISTGATLISDTKAGSTRIEQANFASSSSNSMALTDIGWMSNEAFLSLTIQSIAVANDFGWSSFPFPNIR